MKLKSKDIPAMRERVMLEQGGRCWLCDIDLSSVTPCLDHNHETGFIRGVLCGNCNGIEGKIHNLARRAKRDKTKQDFLCKIVLYWEFFTINQRKEIHPTHKNKDEKRIARNKKARDRRNKLT